MKELIQWLEEEIAEYRELARTDTGGKLNDAEYVGAIHALLTVKEKIQDILYEQKQG